MIRSKTGEEALLKDALKSQLPGVERRAKTSLLTFPITLNNVIDRNAC